MLAHHLAGLGRAWRGPYNAGVNCEWEAKAKE